MRTAFIRRWRIRCCKTGLCLSRKCDRQGLFLCEQIARLRAGCSCIDGMQVIPIYNRSSRGEGKNYVVLCDMPRQNSWSMWRHKPAFQCEGRVLFNGCHYIGAAYHTWLHSPAPWTTIWPHILSIDDFIWSFHAKLGNVQKSSGWIAFFSKTWMDTFPRISIDSQI